MILAFFFRWIRFIWRCRGIRLHIQAFSRRSLFSGHFKTSGTVVIQLSSLYPTKHIEQIKGRVIFVRLCFDYCNLCFCVLPLPNGWQNRRWFQRYDYSDENPSSNAVSDDFVPIQCADVVIAGSNRCERVCVYNIHHWYKHLHWHFNLEFLLHESLWRLWRNGYRFK